MKLRVLSASSVFFSTAISFSIRGIFNNCALLQARLNELMSQIRLQNQSTGALSRVEGRYSMQPALQEELKQVTITI